MTRSVGAEEESEGEAQDTLPPKTTYFGSVKRIPLFIVVEATDGNENAIKFIKAQYFT